MKALHRAVVGGGFGVLAMAGVAGSGAFACTAQAPITGAGGVTTVVATAGATVTVEAKGFAIDAPGNNVQYAGYGKPVFTWNAIDGPVLAVAAEPTWVTTVSGGVNTTRPVWILDVQVPADVLPRELPYGIVGSQTNAHGALYVTGNLPVFITGPATAAPVAPVVAPVVAKPQTGPSTTPNGAPSSTPTPQATATAPTGAPASARPAQPNATAAVQVPTASPSPAAPSSAVGVPRATASGAQTPGGPVDPTKPAPVPPSQELWSGLNGSTSALALLDAPAPATSGSGFPAGAVLLGTGLLALAGTAALAGRRRLAIARAVRR